MPLYDYVCRECGHRMEVMHSVTAAGPEACPVCGGAMRKVIVAAAVHYKGSGWAKVERRTSAAGPKTSTGEPSAGSGSGSGSGSSDHGRDSGTGSSGGESSPSGGGSSGSGSGGSGEMSSNGSNGSGGESATVKASSAGTEG